MSAANDWTRILLVWRHNLELGRLICGLCAGPHENARHGGRREAVQLHSMWRQVNNISTTFWLWLFSLISLGIRIRIRIRVVTSMDPTPDPSIIKPKKVRKTLISTVLYLLYDFFLSLKNDVNRPVFRIRIRRFHMFLALPDPHLNPLVRGTNPRIRNAITNWYNAG